MQQHVALVLFGFWLNTTAQACPACFDRGQARQTILDRVLSSQQAVIAVPMPGKMNQYQVSEVLKGMPALKGEFIRTEAFGKPLNRLIFPTSSLLTYHATSQRWLKQAVLTLSQHRFLKRALKAPSTESLSTHTQRLAFFYPYLDHLDPIIAEAATQEWARAPYTILRASSKLLDRQGVRKQLEAEKFTNKQIKAAPHPLYYILLGLCGTDEDKAFLSNSLGSPEALAAKLTAHLEMQGVPALDWVITHYLKNSERTPDEINAAVDAIGIHGTANAAIPRLKAQQALHLLFKLRPEHVAQAAPYFEQWQDWSVESDYRKLKSDDPKIQAYLSASLKPG